ncbi:MAG: hypothetical protein HY534_00885 [Chloroflexi bacterium]|nr:hypothetical protein [Chloroflexota bacterium]
MSSLSPGELDQILETPISDARIRAFRDSFLKDRETTRTIEKLFNRVHTFRLVNERPAPEEVAWTGFSAILFKAPFTDLGNWAPLNSWSFAVAMERKLLEKFDDMLHQATIDRLGVPVNRDAESVVLALQSFANELTRTGFTPSLFVLSGPLGTQLAVDLQQHPLIVGHHRDDMKKDLGTNFRILGMFGDVPMLDIPESRAPGVYAVDIQRFGQLTRHGEEPVFDIETIGEERARSLLRKSPELGAPSDAARNVADAVRQLQLKVTLELFETYELEVLNKNAAVGSPLEGPILEWEPYRQ